MNALIPSGAFAVAVAFLCLPAVLMAMGGVVIVLLGPFVSRVDLSWWMPVVAVGLSGMALYLKLLMTRLVDLHSIIWRVARTGMRRLGAVSTCRRIRDLPRVQNRLAPWTYDPLIASARRLLREIEPMPEGRSD